MIFEGIHFRHSHNKKPILLVHGVADRAGLHDGFRQKFLTSGYLDSEIYGTTYGIGKPQKFYMESMKCDYVKQVYNHFQLTV